MLSGNVGSWIFLCSSRCFQIMLCDVFREIANLRLISVVLSHSLFISDPDSQTASLLQFSVHLVGNRHHCRSCQEPSSLSSWCLAGDPSLHLRFKPEKAGSRDLDGCCIIELCHSAYLRLLTLTPPKLIPPSTPSNASLIMSSESILKNLGDSMQPCRNALPIRNHSVSPSAVLTADS